MRCGTCRVESQVLSIRPEGPAPMMSTSVHEVGRGKVGLGVVAVGVEEGEEGVAIVVIGKMMLMEYERQRKRIRK